MTPETYRLLHVVGVLLVFLGLGGVLATAGGEGGRSPKLFLMLHGIGLLVMLVCGIGYVHKARLEWQNWLFAKIACWVLIGAIPFLVRRGVVPRVVAVVLVLGLGATAAWLARDKPF
ncbi:MAG: hypothetical protein JNM25_01145 [Planctomycetes bacterium]|nr:hypothetical protein [Planctomycetota bacterium]